MDFSKFGLGHITNIDIVEKPKQSQEKKADEGTKIEDVVYQRKVKCPLCFKEFTTSTIRVGKNQLSKVDDDLRGHYSIIDPVYYDVIHCECGYTAINKAFDRLLPTQKAAIREQIIANFVPIPLQEIRSAEYALDLYQLALLTAVIKKAKNTERAIICLRIAWLYNDLKDAEHEKEYLLNAYQCFKEALNVDSFPILDYDFHRAIYVTAVLAYKCGNYDESLRLIGNIIIDKNLNPKLKERCFDLKNNIKKAQSK
ncbi:MAG: hypothetical protein BEN19_05185 [Epulopiscium sp. Nuni2H_MBin003]|nr:MAG: hypothetical protein BEN19_05185 [Epulopiscium sp. Nuni2H_MBin003]